MSRVPLYPRGGPYPPTTAASGGLPTTTLDTPICAVFIAIYLAFAITNITILRLNLGRKIRFFLQIFLIGFSMSRVVTFALRIVWATQPRNISIAIAAQIFVNAGVLLVYVLNLILAQRILRALQPNLGWNPVLRGAYKGLYFSLGGALIIVITTLVVSLYTLDEYTRSVCRYIQLAALTYLLIFTCLPVPILALATLLPKSRDAETFGTGSMAAKVAIVAFSTTVCILIAGFKAGVNWSPPSPASDPQWYHSKACFYIFNFACEIVVLLLLTASRIDKRFYVPDGCNAPGDYTRLRRQTQQIDGVDGPELIEKDGTDGV